MLEWSFKKVCTYHNYYVKKLRGTDHVQLATDEQFCQLMMTANTAETIHNKKGGYFQNYSEKMLIKDN